VATGVLAVTAIALAVLQRGGGAPAASDEGVLRYELLLPVEIGANSDWGSNVAISPDGRTVAYSGMDQDAEAPGIWIRTADRLEPVFLNGTQLGVHPEFSPDGSQLAFISDDRALRIVSLGGRPPVTLHADPWLRRSGVSWGDDGYIYFGQWDRENGATVLHRIPESGGEVERLTQVDTTRNEVSHYFPDVIPGTDLILVTIALGELYNGTTREIGVARLGSMEVTPLVEGMQAIWSETGHIIVVQADGAVMAATLDHQMMEIGPLIPIFEGVQVESLGSADFAIADDGTFVYVSGQSVARSTPVWVDREGVAVPVDPEWTDAVVLQPRISPDGTRAAFTSFDGTGQNLWVKELDRGPATALTSEGSINDGAAWTADSRSLTFSSNRNGYSEGFVQVADGARPAESLIAPGGERSVYAAAVSPDGRWIVARIEDDIYIQSSEPGSEMAPLLAQPRVIESSFQISPDGRWIAYTSTESGEPMVYVRPFPEVDRGRTVISASAAGAPRWGPDMSELYYRTLSGEFVSAQIRVDPSFAVLSRKTLFAFRSFVSDAGVAQYDVHPDGDRFLMVRLGDTSGRSPVVVVRGFGGEIDRAAGDR
jgi:serine/threonine-protein kinase